MPRCRRAAASLLLLGGGRRGISCLGEIKLALFGWLLIESQAKPLLLPTQSIHPAAGRREPTNPPNSNAEWLPNQFLVIFASDSFNMKLSRKGQSLMHLNSFIPFILTNQ